MSLGSSSPQLKNGHVLILRRLCKDDALREGRIEPGVMTDLSHKVAVPGMVQPRTRGLEVAPQIPCVLHIPPISTLGCPRSRAHSRLPPTTTTADVRHVPRELVFITRE